MSLTPKSSHTGSCSGFFSHTWYPLVSFANRSVEHFNPNHMKQRGKNILLNRQTSNLSPHQLAWPHTPLALSIQFLNKRSETPWDSKHQIWHPSVCYVCGLWRKQSIQRCPCKTCPHVSSCQQPVSIILFFQSLFMNLYDENINRTHYQSLNLEPVNETVCLLAHKNPNVYSFFFQMVVTKWKVSKFGEKKHEQVAFRSSDHIWGK